VFVCVLSCNKDLSSSLLEAKRVLGAVVRAGLVHIFAVWFGFREGVDFF
jgi:glycerol-3-phosphate acyltransferase PlsY